EDSSEPGQFPILRRQPLRDEEAFDSLRTPDDRQAIAVTDQLNLVIHRPLLKRGQGEPRALRPREGWVWGFVFSAVFFTAWLSQCPSGRRRPGEFVEDGSPVAEPFGWVPAVLPHASPSQFSREYRRMFGAPPSRHAPALRAVTR